MAQHYSFFVQGLPIAKGSAKAFVIKGTNRCVVTQTNRDKQRPWASAIAQAALDAGCKPSDGPVMITSMVFYFHRPKSHFGTGKNAHVLKASAPEHHTSMPDVDKLCRCAFDALTGIMWKDDSQVCEVEGLAKRYCEETEDSQGMYFEATVDGTKEGAV